MMSELIRLESEKATQDFANKLAGYLNAPFVMTLSGDIGVGKTTFMRAMLRGLGVKSAIKSPTFTLVETYPCIGFNIHHFDCYRIHDGEELEYIGFREYFQPQSICCIEWPERIESYLNVVDLKLSWTIEGFDRLVQIDAGSIEGEKTLACLEA